MTEQQLIDAIEIVEKIQRNKKQLHTINYYFLKDRKEDHGCLKYGETPWDVVVPSDLYSTIIEILEKQFLANIEKLTAELKSLCSE